jgi:hypothetical protein
MRYLLVTIAAVAAIAVALWQLDRTTDGLVVSREHAGTIPVTVFRSAAGPPAPVVLIAHGFAGSQQLMQPFAVTLARSGYVAVTFDLPGHGRNPAPLPGGLADEDARSRALLGAIDAVARFACDLPAADGRLAVLGHSMASDLVVRYAETHPAVAATVGVSLFSPVGRAAAPRNLLIIDGALEPAMLHDQGYRIVGAAADGAAREGVTYGHFADGTARRIALADGVEHIGVLYSRESMAEALGWMNQVFGRAGGDYIDARGRWLALLYLGLIALAWPLAQLLPRVSPEPLGGSHGWRALLPVAVAPAILTPLMLWKVSADFLPLLLGDYLLLHFALYGALTAAGLWLLGRRLERPHFRAASRPFAIAVLAATAYCTLAVTLPADAYFTSFAPDAERMKLMPVLLCGTLPYFAADEWLTRGAGAARGAYAATKACFLLSLAIAIALSLSKLFFLIIIVPAILAFFIVYGLFSRWAYRRTGHPLVGAVANAVAFAWAIAVTFPFVSR